ncbi:hypothetical protein ACJ73_02021 [Blastomyces percursus]|uniref:Uncharacterized protein n=1 Tax=Blastomyces percursus TaxID=1658174 RepID=A0A1J9RG28_9EURO|nr:hypothetical protein ACJ73_02021 [Blastomyces percursus]
MQARPTLLTPYGLLLRPAHPTRSPAAARAATALICSQCLIYSCLSGASSRSYPKLPFNTRSYHPSRRKNQSALASAVSAAQNLFSKDTPPPPPLPQSPPPPSSSPSPRSRGTSPRAPGTPGGVPITVDPLRIVAKELKFMKKNIRQLLGSGHPLLDRVAKYYTTSEGKHVRPLLVLLMSQATAHAPKTARQLPFVSAAGINDAITSPAILADTNPDQSALLSSTSPSSSEAAYNGLAGNVDADCDNATDILPAQRRLAEITELIHTASLLHDDVIDNAVTRRSAVSANLEFGNKMAVLAGDFLLGRASVALARLRDPEVIELLSTVIANLIEGEFMQLKNTECDELNPSFTDQTITYYLQKTYLKSASLISKSCRAAALLGHSSPQIVEAAYSYGRNLGLAFQLVDDMLDYTISGEELGKPAGADLELGLATAPLLFAWRRNPELGALVGRKFSGEGDVQLARQIVAESDGLEQTRALAQEYTDKAIEAISILPDTEARAGLIEMNDGDECSRFTPPPANRPSTASSDLTSPDTVAKLRRQIDAAEKAIQDVKNSLTPGLTRCFLNKIFKVVDSGGIEMLTAKKLSAHYRANRRRVVKTTRRQVQVRGVLTVKNANRKIANRKAEESKKEHNRMLRSIGIKSTKSTADQPQRPESNISQPTGDSAASNEYIDNLYIIDRCGDYY